MTATKFVKEEILKELRKGNTEVLKGLPPIMAMSYGIAMSEAGKEEAPLSDEAIKEAMLNRLKDSGVKEQLIKNIEEEKSKQSEQN
ncbi:hypothetical protein CHN50_02205 [Priestia aryabhattai]|nr:hypothetical protein CHN50_02205 [Priestia aryabhattai]